jgi:hypothetical protein
MMENIEKVYSFCFNLRGLCDMSRMDIIALWFKES